MKTDLNLKIAKCNELAEDIKKHFNGVHNE